MSKPPITVAESTGITLVDESGSRYTDLCMGFGSAFIGHGNQQIRDALISQLDRDMSPGFLDTPMLKKLAGTVESWLPEDHQLVGVFNGGTEAVELAMRIAESLTGRRSFMGYVGAHHGRSYLTRALGQGDGRLPFVHSLEFLPDIGEQDLLELSANTLADKDPAAVFVEPIHMSGGGHSLSDTGLRDLGEMTRAQGSLLVMDELLSGGYRCGRKFWAEYAGINPDILVCGKAIGGGFPVAMVSIKRSLQAEAAVVHQRNTFTNYPPGLAAIVATLSELERLDAQQRTLQIGDIIQNELSGLDLRGRGAMWIVRFDTEEQTRKVFFELLNQNIVTSFSGRYLRLLPSVIITDEELTRVCQVLRRLFS